MGWGDRDCFFIALIAGLPDSPRKLIHSWQTDLNAKSQRRQEEGSTPFLASSRFGGSHSSLAENRRDELRMTPKTTFAQRRPTLSNTSFT